MGLLLVLLNCILTGVECLLSVQVYDGKDNTAHVLGAFTGSSMLGLTLISTSNHLWLEFFSDTESTGEGFKLVYSSKFTASTANFYKLSSIYNLTEVCGIFYEELKLYNVNWP